MSLVRARIHIAEEQGCSPHLWCCLNVTRAEQGAEFFLLHGVCVVCFGIFAIVRSYLRPSGAASFLKALEEAKMIFVGAISFILQELSTRDISDAVDRSEE